MLQIFGQCPNMSKSSQSVRSALKNLHSSDLTIYAGDGMPDTAALAPSSLNPRAAFPTSSWTRFALEFGMMVGCLVDWRAILLRFGHAMLHEGHAWNSIPIFNIFHVNPGLFRGSACVPDCKPSASIAWLQHYSNRDVESTSSRLTLGSILALLALPWRHLPFCRQQGLQPDSQNTTSPHWQTSKKYVMLRNFSEPSGNDNWPIPL